MWILPKNYPLSSAFAADMVESKEDLTLPGLNIESSLMSRSKPSALPTWLRRWKADSYLPHLYGRILKPSRHTCFETKLASLHPAILVNLSQQQDSEKEKTTQDTCGLTSGDTLNQLDLFSASLKTSRDISRLDSPQLSAIWKKMVIDQRGEYSQRVKSALHTREKESTLWPTPRASEYKDCGPVGSKSHTHMDKKSYLCAKAKDPDMPLGMLNPDWVEWLMGVPTGWTELDSWVTVSCQQQPPKHGVS